MRRFVTRYVVAGAVTCLVGGMLAVVASVTPAAAATPTFKLSNIDIFDTGYNQSYTSVLTVTDSNSGVTLPTISTSSPGSGFSLSGCSAPGATTTCTLTAAPGPTNGDDSGVIGAAGTTNSITFSETDSTGTTTSTMSMIIYPAPICGASGVNPYTGVAGTAGAQIAPDDATYGSPTIAESCYDGASGPPSALLTNVNSAGGTIFLGSNPIDAAGGTALTIMAGPGFNWTGGVGNGEADVDTGTAGLNKQAWGSLGTTATIGSSSTVTLVNISSSSFTATTSATSAGTADVGNTGFPATLVGDAVGGTDIPAGTTVTAVNATGSNSTSTLTLSNMPTATPAAETLTFYTDVVTAGSPTVTVTSGGFPGVTDGDAVGGTDIAAGTTVQSIGGNTLTLSSNAILSTAETLSVSNIVLTDGSAVLSIQSGGWPGVISGDGISGTGIPTGTTVLSVAGNNLTMSASVPATQASEAETVAFTTTTGTPPPSSWLTSSSTVASEASFKSSGDPVNTCPPPQALIDAGLPFCLEEFETTGSGPSASQVAVEYAGQNVPTSQAPTVALSSGSGDIGDAIGITDQSGACPSTVGAGTGNPVPASGLFSGTNNCWYGRAGDSTPVSVTVGGNPATVTPTPTTTSVTNVAVTSGSEVTTVTGSSVPAAFPTNLEGDLVTGAGIPTGTTVTGQGNGTTGNYATVEVTLSNDALATSSGETLTFTNNSDVSESDYSIGASSTVTLVTVTGGSNTVSTTATSAGTADTGSGFPASLAGDAVSGTDIPVGTQVTAVNATGSNSTSSLTLSNSATLTPSPETLTFYPAVLADPQLNATFTIPADTPTGNQPVDVCEATTPNNGNDWEFGVQWMSPTGSLQYVSGSSGPTEIYATSTIDVIAATTSTVTTPTSSSIVLGDSNTDTAVVTGNATAGSPTGSVTFDVCGPTATPMPASPCTATLYTDGNAVGLTAGAGNTSSASSQAFTPTSTGYWCFSDSYSGDANYAGSSDDTTDECFDVTPADSSTVTAPTNSSISLGDSNTDGATVAGDASGVDPTGTVAFYACGEDVDPCTVAGGTLFDTETLSGTSNPDTVTSASFTPDSTGTWCFAAVYSGDGNYNGSSDQSADECYSVGVSSSSTVTSPTNSSIVLGDSNTDGATVTGSVGGVDPTGTVAFYACGENVDPCTSGTLFDTETLSGTSNPGTVTSASFTPTSTGTWCFAAVYSGDSNYSASSDQSSDECYTVTAAGTSTSSAPTSSTGALGGPNSDVAVVTGNAAGGSPSGTVSFYECGPTGTPTPCTSLAHPVGGAVGVTAGAGDTSSATSLNFTATSTGWWCFGAYYSGDSNYSASSDTGTDECYDVTSASTSTISDPTNTTITLGQSDTDHAKVTGNAAGGSPTGTVAFFECGPTSVATPCTSIANQVGGPVIVTAGSGDSSTAASASFTPTSAGYWCYGAYYSGDSNYTPSSDTSVDECVDVVSPVTITTASPLPQGTKGTHYKINFAASGGMAPYKWVLVSGSLPHGITLSSAGKLAGTPTSTGSYTFTVRAKDSSSPKQKATKTFRLTIND